MTPQEQWLLKQIRTRGHIVIPCDTWLSPALKRLRLVCGIQVTQPHTGSCRVWLNAKYQDGLDRLDTQP